MAGVSPYMYEPRFSTTNLKKNMNNEDQGNTKFAGRKDNIDWCECGNCVQMKSDMESFCCKDSSQIREVLGSVECITKHSSFESVVLNIDTLTAARYHMLIKADSNKRDKLKVVSNRLWRHIAYKQFVYWINGWVSLGRRNRKIVPSCAIKRVREEYAETEDNYQGFSAAQGVDPDYFD